MSYLHRINIFGSRQSNAAPPPPSTTPNADHKLRTPLWWPLAKISALIAVPLILLAVYGQPALRMQYTWDGNSYAPVYFKCDYLTLLDGWRHVRPGFGINQCPLIGFFPFDFSKLISP